MAATRPELSSGDAKEGSVEEEAPAGTAVQTPKAPGPPRARHPSERGQLLGRPAFLNTLRALDGTSPGPCRDALPRPVSARRRAVKARSLRTSGAGRLSCPAVASGPFAFCRCVCKIRSLPPLMEGLSTESIPVNKSDFIMGTLGHRLVRWLALGRAACH